MFDVTDPTFLNNPYPIYDQLRQVAPLIWVDEIFGGAWLLPRHKECYDLLRDPRISAKRSHMFVAQLPPGMQEDFGEFSRIFGLWVLFLDGAEHSRLRKLLNKGFSQAWLKANRHLVQHLADELIDRFIDSGSTEFMHDVAHPLPALAAGALLGVEVPDLDAFAHWSDDVITFTTFTGAPPTREVAERGLRALLSITEYFDRIIEKRRKQPKEDDLISHLISAEEDGQSFTTEELVAQCVQFIVGGNETTKNVLGTGVSNLLRHPEQLENLRDGKVTMRDAINEMVRFESTVHIGQRLAAEDFEWHGHQIKQGDFFLPLLASANHDPTVFDNPDQFDITNPQGPGLGFGHGRHFCIGATLAYLEIECAINAIFRRLPNLRLRDPELGHEWLPNLSLRGLNALNLEFDVPSDTQKVENRYVHWNPKSQPEPEPEMEMARCPFSGAMVDAA